jgi:hypothetical protein
MLEGKTESYTSGGAMTIGARLTAGEAARADWLTERLHMTRSELVKALINQEYREQFAASQEERAPR